MNKLLTILTPTYNRESTLIRLYDSLIKQTNPNFEWMIIDDGSTDNTEDIIKEFKGLQIKYIKQENRGKHVALNTGIANIESKLTFIVDSDDLLTENAVDCILAYWQKYSSSQSSLCGMSFNKGYSITNVVGNDLPFNEKISNFIEIRERMNIKGDKAEVWVTQLLKENPFLEIKGEKFLGETYIWWQLAKKYDMLFVNEIIYIVEYLDSGLSSAGRALRIKNPIGGMAHSEIGLSKEFPLRKRVKHAILYVCYGFFAKYKVSNIILSTSYKTLIAFSFVPGYFLYKYWKKKWL